MPVKKQTTSDKPFMSEYDKTVEDRLQELETRVNEYTSGNLDEDRLSILEAKLDDLIQKLQKKMTL